MSTAFIVAVILTPWPIVDEGLLAAKLRDVTPTDIAQMPTDRPPFRVHRAAKRPGEAWPTHSHSEGQLTLAASGLVQVRTDEGVWMVPPQLAAWVPPDVRHHLEIMTQAELWIVHLQPWALRSWASASALERVFALRVTPLLRHLFEEAVSMESAASKKGELIVRLMLHELGEIEDAPTFLPLPVSQTGKRVAELALADRQNRLTIAELAEGAATSVRSVSRLFPIETGLTFKGWRQRSRILHAMERLGRDASIARVCADCGFASTAAFSCAFKQVTGMTPSAFATGSGRRTHRLRGDPDPQIASTPIPTRRTRVAEG